MATGGAADAPGPTWPALLHRLIGGGSLTREQTAWAMDLVMSGTATPAQTAGFLVALRAKGETVEEITGLAETMLAHAIRIDVPGPCVDVVGTGGDMAHTVNISTMAALVVAGAGVRVVKHGNRAASSACGTADVLEALGVRLDLRPEQVARMVEDAGITFCFAQAFHPSFRHAATARRELGVPTAFNFLGPLVNPAQPRAGAIGVADPRMAPLMAGVLAAREASALVVRGEDGLDELTVTGPSRIWLVQDGGVEEHRVSPQDVGLASAPIEALRGGDVATNAAAVRELLAGRPGPVRDAVLLNAAAALVAAGAAPDVRPDGAPELPRPEGELTARLRAGVELATRSVDDGAAQRVLERWVAASASAD